MLPKESLEYISSFILDQNLWAYDPLRGHTEDGEPEGIAGWKQRWTGRIA